MSTATGIAASPSSADELLSAAFAVPAALYRAMALRRRLQPSFRRHGPARRNANNRNTRRVSPSTHRMDMRGVQIAVRERVVSGASRTAVGRQGIASSDLVDGAAGNEQGEARGTLGRGGFPSADQSRDEDTTQPDSRDTARVNTHSTRGASRGTADQGSGTTEPYASKRGRDVLAAHPTLVKHAPRVRVHASFNFPRFQHLAGGNESEQSDVAWLRCDVRAVRWHVRIRLLRAGATVAVEAQGAPGARIDLSRAGDVTSLSVELVPASEDEPMADGRAAGNRTAAVEQTDGMAREHSVSFGAVPSNANEHCDAVSSAGSEQPPAKRVCVAAAAEGPAAYSSAALPLELLSARPGAMILLLNATKPHSRKPVRWVTSRDKKVSP